MNSTTSPMTLATRELLRPILVGGALAGTLDLICAFITLGLNNPKIIAGGLLGKPTQQGGPGIWLIGAFFHYLIAFSAVTIYCLAIRRLGFLQDHWHVSGLFYGVAIYLVMFLIVLPFCAYHCMGPYQYKGLLQDKGLLQGILVYMFLVGLPISFSLRRF